MALQPGMRLGNYEIASLLGEGGFANVYQGYQRDYDRQVAIKVLHEWLAKDSHILSRFREEAIKTFNLQHPNIVRVLDFQEDRGYYFIVMEFVDGQSLRQLINTRDAVDFVHADMAATRMHEADNAKTRLHQLSSSYQELDLGIISSIFRDVCNALSYAHGEGIIHRDVKPDNILVSRDGRALLVDFGIAKAQDEALHLTSTGVRVGSALYMAPEQISVSDKRESDYRTDIYSLGITLYEVLTGTPPFVAEDAQSIWEMQLGSSPVPPSHLKPDLPERLDEVVLKCLEKDPENRYQSATDVSRALSDLIAPKPITVLFPSTPQPATGKRPAERKELVCPVCGYDFHSVEMEVTCPACGYQFSLEEGKRASAQRESHAEKFLRDLGLSVEWSLDVKAHEYDKSIKAPLRASFEHTIESAGTIFADGSLILPEETPGLLQKYTDASAALFDVAALMESQALEGFLIKREVRRYRRQSVHKVRALAYAIIGKYHTALAVSHEEHDKVVQGYEQSIVWYQRAQEHAKQSDEEREVLTSRFEAAEALARLVLDFPPEGQDQSAGQVMRVLDNLPADFWGAGADKEKASSYQGLYAAKSETIEKAKNGIADTQVETLGLWEKWRASDENSPLAPARARLNILFSQKLPALLQNYLLARGALWGGVLLVWILSSAFTASSLFRVTRVLSFVPLPRFLLPSPGGIRLVLSGLLILVPWVLGYWRGYAHARPSERSYNRIDLILSYVAVLTLLPWLGIWLYGALLMGLGFLAGKYLGKENPQRGAKIGALAGGALSVLFLLYVLLYAAPLALVLSAILGLAGWVIGGHMCRLDVTITALRRIENDLSVLEKESGLLVARLLYSVDRDKFVNVEELKSSVESFKKELTETISGTHVAWDLGGFTARLKERLLLSLHRIKQTALGWRRRERRTSNPFTRGADQQDQKEDEA